MSTMSKSRRPPSTARPLSSTATTPLVLTALSTALTSTVANAAVYPLSTIVARLQTQRILLRARRARPPSSKRAGEKYLVDEGAFEPTETEASEWEDYYGGRSGSSERSSRYESGGPDSKARRRRGRSGRPRRGGETETETETEDRREKSRVRLERMLSRRLEDNLRMEDGEMYAGVFDAAWKIWRKEGLKGFYRGIGDDSIETFAGSLIYFLSYTLLRALPPSLNRTGWPTRTIHNLLATLLSHILSPILLPSITHLQTLTPAPILQPSFWPSYLLSITHSLLKSRLSKSFLPLFFTTTGSPTGAPLFPFLQKLFAKLLAVFITYPLAVIKTCHNLEIPLSRVVQQGFAMWRGADGECWRSGIDAVITAMVAPGLQNGMMGAYLTYLREVNRGVRDREMVQAVGKERVSVKKVVERVKRVRFKKPDADETFYPVIRTVNFLERGDVWDESEGARYW